MNVADLVEKALKERPETRSNDKKLMYLVWYLQEPEFYKEENFKRFFLDRAHSPESITRCRRKLQEGGKYPAEAAVEKARAKKFREMRESAPKAKANQLPL